MNCRFCNNEVKIINFGKVPVSGYKSQTKEENLEASRQRTAEYHRKLDAERELEMKLRREERQQLRQSWANEPEPEKKPKKDNDFDLSM